jgi:hypothetical protein
MLPSLGSTAWPGKDRTARMIGSAMPATRMNLEASVICKTVLSTTILVFLQPMRYGMIGCCGAKGGQGCEGGG